MTSDVSSQFIYLTANTPEGLFTSAVTQVPAVLGVCQSVVMFITSHFFHPPVFVLCCRLCVHLVCFSLVEKALDVSCIWHVLMLTELPLSDNVTIS